MALLEWTGHLRIPSLRDTLERPMPSSRELARDLGEDWVDGRQTARPLGLQAHHRQEAEQTGEVFLLR
jgi:hypothetical protein